MTKTNSLRASLVIPVFNNGQTIRSQLLKCNQVLSTLCDTYEIIISDDASQDKTKEILHHFFSKRNHFKIYYQEKNLGIAKNIFFLYKKAKYPTIILFSVDGGWDPKDIRRLLIAASTDDADIVVGKRVSKKYSLYRKCISIGYNKLVMLLFGVDTIDAGSIKVFKRSLFITTKLDSKSVFFEAELLIRAIKNKKRVIAVPVTHTKTHMGMSGKLPIVFDSLRDMLKLRFHGL